MSLFSLLFKYKDKKSPDKLGLYPESIHVPSFPERRYLWTSRILVICAILSICLNIALTIIIYILLPQKTSHPTLFNINEKNNVLDRVPYFQENTNYLDLLTEGYIYEYINLRHSIPKSTADLYYRWDNNSKFYWYSGAHTYSDFINKLNNQQITNFINQRMKRTIEIDSIKKITANFWEVKFKTSTTTRTMTTPDVILWNAYLRINYIAFEGYDNIEKNEKEKTNYNLNPFGFKVMSYILGYAGKHQESHNKFQKNLKITNE